MKSFLFFLLIISVPVISNASALCAKWNGIAVEAKTTESLFQKMEAVYYKPYFEKLYEVAQDDETTTLTFVEFKSRYLPFLNYSMQEFLKSGDSDGLKNYEIDQAIKALPKEPGKLYKLYASHFSYEDFLYEWTLSIVRNHKLNEKNLSIEEKDMYPGRDLSGSVGSLSQSIDQATAKSLSSAYRQRTSTLQKIRKALMIGEMADEIELCSGIRTTDLKNWSVLKASEIVRRNSRMGARALAFAGKAE